MSEERLNPDTDGVTDALVSQTYRESASEHVPEALDRAVLSEANKHSSNRYSRSLIWLRPMAWAATISLCLAIVVEINSVPQPESVEFARPAMTADEVDVGGSARSDLDNANAPQRFEVAPLEQRARKSVAAPEPASRAEGAIGLVEPKKAEEVLKDSVIEEAVIMREGGAGDSNLRSIERSANPAAAAIAPMPCDAAARETAESWLECIEMLEEAGLDDVASQQREQLQEAFPDFEMP